MFNKMKMWYYLWSPLMITFSFYFMEYKHPLPQPCKTFFMFLEVLVFVLEFGIVFLCMKFLSLCFCASWSNLDLNSFFFMQIKKSLLLTLLLYTIKVATYNFFGANKLGECGFGVVYKVNVTLLLTLKGIINEQGPTSWL